MAEGPGVQELLAVARADYARRLPAKVGEVETLCASRAWADVRRAAHRLRGSAATYGFPTVSAAAAVIEDLLIAAPGGIEGDSRMRLEEALAVARAEADHASREPR